MGSIDIGRGADVSDRTVSGSWHLHGVPAEMVMGALTIVPGQALVLRLSGGFPDSRGGARTIFGRAATKNFTLRRAFCSAESTQGELITEQEWTCYEAFEGWSYFHGDDDTLYDYVDLRTFRLEDWLPGPAREFDAEFDESRVSIAMRLPGRVKFSLPGRMDLDMGWHRGGESTGRRGSSIELEPAITARLAQPSTLDRVWAEVVSPLTYFVILATGGPDRIRHIGVGERVDAAAEQEDPDFIPPGYEWLSTGWRGTRPTAAAVYWGEHFIPFTEFEQRMPDLMEAWFSLYDKAAYPLQEYFLSDVFEGPSVFEEDFARSVRCLEVYHRVTKGGEYLPRGVFNDLVGRLKDAAHDVSERSFVAMRMNFANELTLKQRLEDLIAHSCGLLEMEVGRRPKFVRRVVDTRNNITHQSTTGEFFSPPQMAEARDILRRIMRANILRDIGFAEDEVQAALVRSPEYARGGVRYEL